MVPVCLTSTYVQTEPGRHKGFDYIRSNHPTRLALQRNLAALEEAKHGLCFASGLAAESAILQLLKPGDQVVSGRDLYGGTYRLFEPPKWIVRSVPGRSRSGSRPPPTPS